ncbi:hypothetical protein J8F10_33590 [Gemmata sp. G18]|uniref:Uncharacterized protein n=1 Tax=Gemmata palustris TaxID=2822762 RepID=A0ABS5C2I6_9BACT|nr:hypothetical protein [Gemmata palustris]MBP3960187.1 hypothetical protein [Gemmata palustris]
MGIGADAHGLIAEFELGVAEERAAGDYDEPPGHFQDDVSRTCLGACRQLLGLGFESGAERFGRDGLLLGYKPPVIPNYNEVNTFRTNYRHTYPFYPLACAPPVGTMTTFGLRTHSAFPTAGPSIGELTPCSVPWL